MSSALLVWLWLVLGLKALSAGGAWYLGWGGALGLGILLWPICAGGYVSLRRLMFSSAEDSGDEARQMAWDAVLGVPLIAVSLCWSLLVIGLFRFLGSFSELPRGGMLNFIMSVVALHLLVWVGTGLSQWALAAWREREN